LFSRDDNVSGQIFERVEAAGRQSRCTRRETSDDGGRYVVPKSTTQDSSSLLCLVCLWDGKLGPGCIVSDVNCSSLLSPTIQ